MKFEMQDFAGQVTKMQSFDVAQKWKKVALETKIAQNTALEYQLIFYRIGKIFRILGKSAID